MDTNKGILLIAGAVSACLANLAFASDELAGGSDAAVTAEEISLPEFRSMITIGNQTLYSLHDPENGESFWITQHEVRNGIEVLDFEAEENALSVYLGDEIHQLNLSPSRIEELVEAAPDQNRSRRPSREERRERFNQFQQQWSEATRNSAQLGQLNEEIRSMASEWRDIRSARRAADRGSDERSRLREQERIMGREIRLMGEYVALHATQSGTLQNDRNLDAEAIGRMIRISAFRSPSN